jgi:thiamine-phosphate pyrophosphorylase
MPRRWLVSDARNDAVLERALARLPSGSGFIFRHYHLPVAERRARFGKLLRIARKRGVWIMLAGPAAEARAWGADGAYGPVNVLKRGWGPRLATAHSLAEIGAANRAGVDVILLSPAFATRSHPGGRALGPVRWRLMAARAQGPVIALGGMNMRSARRLGAAHWAAIDGLSPAAPTRILDATTPSGALCRPQQGT